MSAFEREMRKSMRFLSPKPSEEQIREFVDMCEPSDRFMEVAQKARAWMTKHGLQDVGPLAQLQPSKANE